jgi:hypothetical protein
MLKRLTMTLGMVLALAACFATVASAGVPFPGLSTCTVTITQFPTRLQCITSWDPDVVRLTPAGSTASPLFDRVSITVRVRDANNLVVPNALIAFSEQTGVVNIANGGSTTATTDANGSATVSMHAGSGYGRVALCADGVQLCNLMVRTPDVAKSGIPAGCTLATTGSSFVAATDITNVQCGFTVNFGPVTVGVNDPWDLNCDSFVSGTDVTGILGKGGVLQYFGDGGVLGATNSCALP